MTRRELVHQVARLLSPRRRESAATLRGAADVIARAGEGDEVAQLFVREAIAMADTSPHVAELLDDAARTMAELKASLAQSERTGLEVKGAGALPAIKTVRDVQRALFVLGYHGPHRSPVVIDGIVGPSTLHALRHFQRSHGFAPDGALSPVTVRELEWRLYEAGWDASEFPSRVSEVPTEQTGYSDPGHAYGPRPRALHVQQVPHPYSPESYAFPWHGRARAEVPISPRQLGDPLYAAARTPWMGAQGYGAQYVMHDQDLTDEVPSPSYRWHWLEHDDPEGERC